MARPSRSTACRSQRRRGERAIAEAGAFEDGVRERRSAVEPALDEERSTEIGARERRLTHDAGLEEGAAKRRIGGEGHPVEDDRGHLDLVEVGPVETVVPEREAGQHDRGEGRMGEVDTLDHAAA
jgi:hypothetical protein